MAELDAYIARRKENERRIVRILKIIHEPIESALSDYYANCQNLAHSALQQAGYHLHARSQWRRRRFAGEHLMPSTPPPPSYDLQTAIDSFGDIGGIVLSKIIKNICGSEPEAHDGLEGRVQQIQAELEGAHPSPLERLLCQRAAICWLSMYGAEYQAKTVGAYRSEKEEKFRQELLDRAQKRFIQAVKTLAQVRKLLGG